MRGLKKQLAKVKADGAERAETETARPVSESARGGASAAAAGSDADGGLGEACKGVGMGSEGQGGKLSNAGQSDRMREKRERQVRRSCLACFNSLLLDLKVCF